MKGFLRNMQALGAALLFTGGSPFEAIDTRAHIAPPIGWPKEPRAIKRRNGDVVGFAKPDRRTRRFKWGRYGKKPDWAK